MAWTAPRTWVVGEMVTFTVLNVHVRDNLIFIGTSHNHASAGSTAGSPALGTLDSITFRTQAPFQEGLNMFGTTPLWTSAVGIFSLNKLQPTSTITLLSVGTIDATTGGTIAADGTHNHVV